MRQATQKEIENFVSYRANHIALVERLGKLVFNEDYSNHDFDKCTPNEEDLNLFALRYEMINGSYNPNNEDKKKLNNLVKKHVLNNKHHPEYWSKEYDSILRKPWDEDNPPIVNSQQMPKRWLREMIADWGAVAIKKNCPIFEWYNKTCTGKNPRFIFTDNQKEYIIDCLELIAKAIKKEHIQYPGITYNAKQVEPIKESLNEDVEIRKGAGDKDQILTFGNRVADYKFSLQLGKSNEAPEDIGIHSFFENSSKLNKKEELDLADKKITLPHRFKENINLISYKEVIKKREEDPKFRKDTDVLLKNLPDICKYSFEEFIWDNYQDYSLFEVYKIFASDRMDKTPLLLSDNGKEILGWINLSQTGHSNIIYGVKFGSFNPMNPKKNYEFFSQFKKYFEDHKKEYKEIHWIGNLDYSFIRRYIDIIKENNGSIEKSEGNYALFKIGNIDRNKSNVLYANDLKDINNVEELKKALNNKQLKESIDITQSENFKEWFGNSKVVDENGKPLVVYHGTSNFGFNTFKTPVFFSDNLETASRFGWENTKFEVSSLKNYSQETDYGRGVYACYLKFENPEIFNANGRSWDDLKGPIHSYETEDWWNPGYTTEDLIKDTKKKGKDSVIIYNVLEGSGIVCNDYIAFYPNQIKSATDNNGNFDPNSDKITESEEQIYTAKFKNWFGDWEKDSQNASKVVDKDGKPLIVYHGTRKAGFDEFKYDPNNLTGDNFGETYFFTSSKKVALGYAYNIKNDPRYTEIEKERNRLASIVIDNPTEENKQNFLNRKRCSDLFDTPYITEGSEIKEVYLRIERPYIIQGYEKNFREVYPKNIERFKKWGNDGVIIYNVQDNAHGEDISDIYIVFNPNQIKSATDNNGNFDLNSNKITESEEDIEELDKWVKTWLSDTSKPVKKLLAPNGKESNLNKKQWITVRTPQFKKWFGDWENNSNNSSKVIDNNGEPLVVYHGTEGAFDFFLKDVGHSNSYKEIPNGFYFTNSRQVARHYGSNVLACFLKIINPKIIDAEGRKWDNIIYNNQELSTDEIANVINKTEPQYDGVIFKHVVDGSTYPLTVYIVFNPNQIKSIENNGEFSIKSGKIIESKGLLAPNGNLSNLTSKQWNIVRTPQFKKWFGDWENNPQYASKVIDDNGEPLVVYHGTNEKFDSFNIYLNKNGKELGFGSYFTSDKEFAKDYGNNLIGCFLNIRNPWNPLESVNRTTKKFNNMNKAEKFFNDKWKEYEERGKGYQRFIPIVEEVDNGFEVTYETEYKIEADETNDGIISGRTYVIHEPNQVKSAYNNNGEFNIKSNKITESMSQEIDREILKKLESSPTIKTYRAMQVIDGKLYPPMSAITSGSLRKPIELGKWEKAEENLDPKNFDKNGKFILRKGNGKTVPAAYNPYFHSSTTMLNDQFSEAQSRPNLVTVETEIPTWEVESSNPYHADKAKDSVGKIEWKAGIIQGQLTGTRTVYLSRYDKPIRIVPDSEVAKNIVDMFKGKDITMPTNVVTPSVREELEKLGVKFIKTNNRGIIMEGENTGKTYSSIYNTKNSKENIDLSNTKIRNRKGEPLKVYHCGTYSGNSFLPYTHFGTKKAAVFRVFDKELLNNNLKGIKVNPQELYNQIEKELTTNGKYKDYYLTKAYLNITNPVKAKDAISDYKWESICKQAEDKGYDGIVYKNESEDIGSFSFIAFKPEQIILCNKLNESTNKLTEDGEGGGAVGGASSSSSSSSASSSTSTSSTASSGQIGGATNNSQRFLAMAPAKPAKIGGNKHGLIDPSGQLLKENNNKTVAISYGRFCIPQNGYIKLWKKLAEIPADSHLVYASHSYNKKNPISYSTKSSLIKYLLKEYNINAEFINSDSKTILDIAGELYDKGYKSIIFIGGQDRVDEITNLLKKYNNISDYKGKFYNFDTIEGVSGGKRDPDSEDIEGISGTKMRQFIKDNDFESFKKNCPIKEQNILKNIWEEVKNVIK